MPLGELAGIGPDAAVTTTGRPLTIGVAPGLLGRVLDGLGRPADGGGPIANAVPWAVDRPAPDPLSRARITRPLPLGVRALDALLTAGEGQRLGLFAGSGVGKSTLLGQIARQTEADVNVIALVGERGREVGEFLDASLGAAGRAALGRRVRDERRAQPRAPALGLRRDRHRRVVPGPGQARALHARLAHARRAGAARGGPRRGRAARAPGLPAQRLRQMLPRLLERTGTDDARLDHGALHRARRGRRHGRAHRRRGAGHSRRSRRAVARAGVARSLPRRRRPRVAVAPHERRSPRRRTAPRPPRACGSGWPPTSGNAT